MSTPSTPFGLLPFFNASSHTAYQTNFNWQFSTVSALPKSCVRVQSGPNRYVDINQNLRTDFYSGTTNLGSASGSTSTCEWDPVPVTGSAVLNCDYTYSSVSPNNKSFILYSNSACTVVAASGSPKVFNVSRTVNVGIHPTCTVPLTSISYQSADSSHPQRFTWTCPSLSAGSVFTSTGNDSIAIPISPFTRVGTFNVSGAVTGKSLSVNNLRYQPLMPDWFEKNDWYLTAFYAVAPSKAPSPVTPCGITTQLSAGANSGGDAIVMLAGSRLPNLPAAPTQIRPSASLDQYLESPNLTAGTSCAFSASRITTTSTSNDQVLVISP